MVPQSLTRLAVAVGGLALSLTAGAGVASADPDLGPAINTTCSYSQVGAALNAEDPAAAAQFNASPMTQGYLRQFLASPPARRQQLAQQAMAVQGLRSNLDSSRSSPTPATTTERSGATQLAQSGRYCWSSARANRLWRLAAQAVCHPRALTQCRTFLSHLPCFGELTDALR